MFEKQIERRFRAFYIRVFYKECSNNNTYLSPNPRLGIYRQPRLTCRTYIPIKRSHGYENMKQMLERAEVELRGLCEYTLLGSDSSNVVAIALVYRCYILYKSEKPEAWLSPLANSTEELKAYTHLADLILSELDTQAQVQFNLINWWKKCQNYTRNMEVQARNAPEKFKILQMESGLFLFILIKEVRIPQAQIRLVCSSCTNLRREAEYMFWHYITFQLEAQSSSIKWC